MTIFLLLAPYGAFAALVLVASPTVSLVAAACVCALTIAVDLCRARSVKILAAGSAILFAGLAAYLALIDPGLSDKAVKLAVDIGIFAISLGSMMARRPFTMQYAVESVSAEIAARPGFVRANYIITGVWTAAALLIMAANAAELYVPGLPIWLGLAVVSAARYSAASFTKWYPAYRRRKYGTPPNALPTAR